MKKTIIALTASLILTACTPDTTPKEGIVISSLQVRAPLGEQTTTAGYFSVTNYSNVDDALIGAESPVADRVEMHFSESINGIREMRRQVSVDLPSGASVAFEPGGYHLMLFNVDLPKDQKDVALTLKFKHAPDMTIIADITGGKNYGSSH